MRGPAGARGPEVSAHGAPSTNADSRGSHAPGGGIDLGWLAACLGLIAAATALGRPDATRKLAVRGRDRFGALLHPASRGS